MKLNRHLSSILHRLQSRSCIEISQNLEKGEKKGLWTKFLKKIEIELTNPLCQR
uniref:Uncharacterized protein n=1 Tax=Rhizophora mucronata TaxID=61149 RepID=A0A2P2QKT4_RHIMU